MLLIGCDLARISRWQNASARRLERIFSALELAEFAKRFLNQTNACINETLASNLASYLANDNEAARSLAQSLAGNFAAKEAIAKALGVGISNNLSWQDIYISRSQNGAPFASLSKLACKRFEAKSIQISISHDGDYALAFCIINNL